MANTESILELLSPARREVLAVLRREGESWAAGLAAHLNLSVSALRQTLTALEAEGLVTSRQVRAGPGRPRVYYRLSESAEGLFEGRQSVIRRLLDVALELVDAGREVTIASWTARLVEAQARADHAAASAAGDGAADLVRDFAAFGYAPEADRREPGVSHIVLRHCPIVDIARERPVVCEIERQYGERRSGGTLQRKAYRLDGDDICQYDVIQA